MSVKKSSQIAAEIVTAGSGTTRQVLIGPEEGPHFAMRKFVMDPGGGMPTHTNSVEHEQYVIRGAATVSIGDDVYQVGEGDVVFIPAGVPHSYRASDEGFEFLCIVPNGPDEIRLL
ncbi:MAG: cupin domain-containing protein [Rhodothermales bacterium]|nr:cupin domain-containing protein [Rhodothermales bacterium]